ncbi:MAG TPA: 16S rRNA (guanine(527)-N(7))-methyltransferase RsmG [Sphingobacterium sp.]|nr:16S rRNA (guanine(527)-N(7))-methyltransferase RsmG [Sphingobacterium sp.]
MKEIEKTNNEQVSIIFEYFPDLDEKQRAQFVELYDLYMHWNSQINVISRKDMDNFYTHHVLHALALAKHIQILKPKTKILDVGTGGGFPGIPMAIYFPEVTFHLVDSIGKKIKVVDEISNALDLKNVQAQKIRAEDVKEKYDFIISRAVTRFSAFIPWIKDKFNTKSQNEIPNGLFYLKGGDVTEEIKEARIKAETFEIADHFNEEFFETKKIIYVPM